MVEVYRTSDVVAAAVGGAFQSSFQLVDILCP